MYQTVGHQAIQVLGKAINVPLYRRFIDGDSLNQSKDYDVTLNDEVEDLYQLIIDVQV